jgi:hypothetical protein
MKYHRKLLTSVACGKGSGEGERQKQPGELSPYTLLYCKNLASRFYVKNKL